MIFITKTKKRKGIIVSTFLFLCLVCVCSSIATADDLKVVKTRLVFDYVHPYEGILIQVSLENTGSEDLKDLSIRVAIPDLDTRTNIGLFDLDTDDGIYSKLIYLPLSYDARPGEYMVRVTVSNNDVRRIKHRIINIV